MLTEAVSTHAERKSNEHRNRKARHFMDKLLVQVQAGHGGDGCVSFHREKFVEMGPAAGGNGGAGGFIFIKADPSLHSLARVHKRVVAKNGTHGQGDWLHGRGAEDIAIHVPVGTTVRSIGRTLNEREASVQPYMRHVVSAKQRAAVTIDALDTPVLFDSRAATWRHFPRFEDENYARGHFAAAEEKFANELKAQQRFESKLAREKRSGASLSTYVEVEPSMVRDYTADAGWAIDMAIPTPPDHPGLLVARGGEGGLGNPHFILDRYRSPKIATRGGAGESVLLSLEYKQPSDVGLVGLPNAGKSTLLRCLSRADAEIGSYAFTTLHPNLGVMCLDTNGRLLDADAPEESMRLIVADLPGLIEDASHNKGLGLEFLRHVERCRFLVYVVDIGPSNAFPIDHVLILNKELEAYCEGLSRRVAMIVANKADLLATEGTQESIQAAHAKLSEFRTKVQDLYGPQNVAVVPMSAQRHENVDHVVQLLQSLASTVACQ
ncbi:[histone H3]-dimethyl-L-lysine(36) demethylase [Malassezia vespertilionis]|uniref:[histone H3]-dimethyl-L-lysine(36) demethylase n=1 Tax=Malassezia vespertilionis TaxID=2020962 RepID=UPI0024B16877|nr:[histone H3]-dimethyl-L-lysine(36) demethylase [Malassezia vespertilionis]WFD07920.1 [histone H3]-dimethyl-L-lysine(36) demethylase [Malassezia vespertilionis]